MPLQKIEKTFFDDLPTILALWAASDFGRSCRFSQWQDLRSFPEGQGKNELIFGPLTTIAGNLKMITWKPMAQNAIRLAAANLNHNIRG